MRFNQKGSNNIGEATISHNLSAFNHNAGYGVGQRMGLLIYPIIAYNTFYTIDKSKLKVLLVGCRTEDDIFWMRSYGYSKAIGFDLFSYSDNVIVGDIHKTEFPSQSFDIVLLGWMISYTKDPAGVVKECRRILKDGGLLGIGIEHNPTQDNANLVSPRVNALNSTSDIISLLDTCINHKVIFEYDHYNDKMGDFSTTVVTICK
ncbi:MAG: class I SAM-dependent methyltransferase [Cyclobacteriaceae bacterium]